MTRMTQFSPIFSRRASDIARAEELERKADALRQLAMDVTDESLAILCRDEARANEALARVLRS